MHISFGRMTSCLFAWGIGTIVLAPTAETLAAKSTQTWSYVAQTAEDGSPNRVLARLMGEEGSAFWLSCTRIAREETEPAETIVAATVTQKAYLGPSEANGRSTVYWLDGRPPELSYWVYRDRYGQLREQDQVRSLVASLTTAETLTVDLTDYRLEPRTVKFALKPSETKAVLERFARDCQAIPRARNE